MINSVNINSLTRLPALPILKQILTRMKNKLINILRCINSCPHLKESYILIKGSSMLIFLLLICFCPKIVQAQNAVQSGQFIVEPPTLTNLGFEWYIQGDNNRNSSVFVEYRVAGTQKWKEALPL
jgi:hypothetical protein